MDGRMDGCTHDRMDGHCAGTRRPLLAPQQQQRGLSGLERSTRGSTGTGLVQAALAHWHQGHQGHQGHSARPLSSGSGSGSAPGSTPTPTQPSQRPPASENIYNLPNALTLSRIVMTPFIGLLIVQQAFPAAVALLSVAAFTDLADGFIARRYNLKTALGSALDPAADKILMTTLTVSLCQAGLLPLYLAVLIIGRDVGLVLATAYYRYATLPAPVSRTKSVASGLHPDSIQTPCTATDGRNRPSQKTVQRYFNLALPSAEVRPPFISKLNTLLQLTLMGASLCMPLLGLADAMLLTLLQYTVAVTTIWSGLHYMFAKDVIKAIK
ncbi:CDP-alcohol phosphatidyltransferase-domain-containing protein [Entophlyctis helioformis]|nr:CDP-alcohol phosphatidyltransferase-domain-containing protein [Entophlyctis helioformis]